MKISKIDIYPLKWKYPKDIYDSRSCIKNKSALIIKITSDNIIYGIGEVATFGEVSLEASFLIKNKLETLILGKKIEPKNIKDFLVQNTAHYGQKGIILSAISGIEIALWDILGKFANLPITNLLGSGIKKIKIYASTGYYISKNNPVLDLKSLKIDIKKIDINKFSGIKIKIGKYGILDDIKRIKTARELIGNNKVLIVDLNNAYNVRDALKLSKLIEKYEIFFIEEPIPFGQYKESFRLRNLSNVAIGGYELEGSIDGFYNLIDDYSVDYIQPDTIWNGGIFDCLLIGDYSKRHGISMIPHNFSTSVALAANLHMLNISSNGEWIEYDHTGNPFMFDILVNNLLIKNGEIILNNKPGLGVELDMNKINNYLIK